MSDEHRDEFAGSVPDNYQRYLVPLIFQPFADDLAERVSAQRPNRVLETAAGTGVLTRAMASRLPGDVQIVATDLAQPMLVRAEALLDDPRVTWRQTDAKSLPFENASFDTVVCQFGAMFFPDRPAAYREVRRVLRPFGSFMAAIWGPLEANPLSYTVNETLRRLFPDDPPDFMARTPHSYWQHERIAADIAAGGFDRCSIEDVTKRARAASARDVAIAFCRGTPTAPLIQQRVADDTEVVEACTAAIASQFGTGPIDAPIEALIVTAL